VLVSLNYENTLAPYTDPANASHELWGELFGFVRILNIAIVTSFSSFAVINAVHQCKRFNGCCKCREKPSCCMWFDLKEQVGGEQLTEYMFWAEYAYVVASFVSKGLLVIIVSAGATTQPGGD
jgi:hypothetical protein